MTDVARLAGVSHQTVSRVVNNHSNVSPEVRDRVELAIRRLRYRRNPSARALASSRSLTVGVISFGLAQFGPSVILTGIVAEAERAGYTTSLVTLADPLRDLQPAVDHLLALPVDGIIVVAPIDTALVSAREIVAGVPLVVFEPGAAHLAGNVVTDEVAGARAATEHLLSLGHRTVHHVSGPAGWLGTSARLRGWSDALAAAGRPQPQPLVGDWTTGSGFEAGLRLAADAEVTAVFVANDQMALGVIKALVTRGRPVPAGVSVVGFDDLPEAPYFIPALTTMRIDFSEVGRLAVSRLLALITAETDRADRSVDPELVVRASTAAPPLQNTHHQGATS